MKSIKNNFGFTYVEMFTAVAILSILGMVAFSMFESGSNIFFIWRI